MNERTWTRRLCGHQISLRIVCCCYPIRGYQHCRHHLTPAERAQWDEWKRRSRAAVSPADTTEGTG